MYEWNILLAGSAAYAAAIQQLPAIKGSRKPRRRLNWDEHARECIEKGTSKRKHRMTLIYSKKLIAILRSTLKRNVRFGGMRGGAVSMESRMVIALRLLAEASYLDLVHKYGVAKCTVYWCLWSVVDAINALEHVGPFWFPGGVEECRKLAADFKDKSEKGCMNGVVGAIDGLFVEIAAPAASECLDQLSYYSGAKNGDGINVQAIATANYRFSGVTAKHPGSTSDFTAYIRSSLPAATAAQPSGVYIIGDAASSLSEKLLTPYAGKGLAEEYDVFNVNLSQLRIKVEQSFGILVQTWGKTWKPIHLCHAGRADVITALFHLHDYLQDENMGFVRFEEADTCSQALRPSVGNDNRLPSSFKVPRSSTANVRRGETPTREALPKSMATLGLNHPANNITRNPMIEL